jgi:hypothetical protein
MNIRIIVIGIIAALALVGCGDRLRIEGDGAGGVNISVSLTEAEVNQLIQEALAQGDRALRDVNADLQPGQIVISGVYDQADGTSVSGTITLAASVSDGLLDIQVRNVNIAGWNANDSQLNEWNSRIEQGLNEAASRDDNFTIVSIAITDSTLTINTNINENNS